MTRISESLTLPSAIETRLRSIRFRWRLTQATEGLLTAMVVLLAAMMVAMIVDEVFVLFDTRWRCLLTWTSLWLAAVTLLIRFIRPLVMPQRLSMVAMNVEAAVPRLEERWSTIAELSETQDPPEIRGSDALIRRVADEAVELGPTVSMRAVVRRDRVRAWAVAMSVLLAILAVTWLAYPSHVGVLIRRFCMPRTPITQTQIASLTGNQVVCRGEPLTLEARVEGRARQKADLVIHRAGMPERRTTHNLTAGAPDVFACALRSVKEPFSYRWECGDGTSDWFEVRAEDRPAVAKARVRVIPPAYSKLPEEQHDGLPQRVRALRGSLLQVDFLPTKPLSRMEVILDKERTQTLAPGPGLWYRYEATLETSFILSSRLTDEHGLNSLGQASCRIIVYEDRPPKVEIVSPNDDVTARPDEKIDVEFKAEDEFGIASAELVVTVNAGDQQTTSVIPVPLGELQGTKDVKATAILDLKAFDLKHGDELSYAVRVHDTRLMEATSQAMGSGSQQQAQLAHAGDQGAAGTQPSGTSSTHQEVANAGQQASSPGQPSDAGGSATQPAGTSQGPQDATASTTPPDQGRSLQPGAPHDAQAASSRSEQSAVGNQNQASAGRQDQASGGKQGSKSGDRQDQRSASGQGKQSDGKRSPQPDMAEATEPGTPKDQNQQASAERTEQQGKSTTDQQASTSQPSADMASASGSKGKPSDGDSGSMTPPPPNNMSKRALDVSHGSASSKALHLQIDEYVGTYEGQARKKRQIAISNYLQRVREALIEAGQATDSTLEQVRSRTNWDEAQQQQVTRASTRLGDADKAIAELKVKSGTNPYAFVGLQLVDISAAHIKPARIELASLSPLAETPPDRLKALTQAAYHIDRAIQLLDDLTREFNEVVKQEQQERTLEQLAKMYQAFVEDTYAMLRACKPLLNPRAGKWQIIPDEMAEAILKALNERADRKKELMAALAKALADDPDLLNRFMANMRKSAMTLRDQATVLARRQQQLRDHVTGWMVADERGRKTLLDQHLQVLADERKETALLAAQIKDNVKTWVPRNLSAGMDKVDQCHTLADQVASLARQTHSSLSFESLPRRIQEAEALLRHAGDLQTAFAELQSADESNARLISYAARRLTETSNLALRVQCWIERAQALLKKEYHAAAAVEQGALVRDTSEFGAKMETVADSLSARFPPEIGGLARQLAQTLNIAIPGSQGTARLALQRSEWPVARLKENEAVDTFASAERQFDDLLTAIEEFIASQPPAPPMPAAGMPLEKMLASILDERDAVEALGAVIRTNLLLQSDWLQPGDGPGSGMGNNGQQGQQPNQSPGQPNSGKTSDRPPGTYLPEVQAAAAEARAREAELLKALEEAKQALENERGNQANKRRERETKLARERDAQKDRNLPDTAPPLRNERDFNIPVSVLEHELRQARGTVPPEQYREAIDAYFRDIADAAARASRLEGE